MEVLNSKTLLSIVILVSSQPSIEILEGTFITGSSESILLIIILFIL